MQVILVSVVAFLAALLTSAMLVSRQQGTMSRRNLAGFVAAVLVMALAAVLGLLGPSAVVGTAAITLGIVVGDQLRTHRAAESPRP